MHEPLYKDVPDWISKLGTHLEKSFPGRNALLEILRRLDGNIRDNYRKHVGDSAQPSSGGGGGVAPRPSDRYLGQVIVQIDKAMSVPEHRVTYSIWGRPDKRYLVGIYEDTTIRSFVGTIDIEPMIGGPPQRYYIRCTTSGKGLVEAGRLVGFTVGFARFNAERGKFFVKTYVFPKETTNVNPAQIVNEIALPGQGATYYSDDVILGDALLDEYDTTGGSSRAGMRIHTNLAVYA